MKVVFLSNYLNHHQLPFCLEMRKKLQEDFVFVATTKISQERLILGYEDMNEKYDFVVRAYDTREYAMNLSNESDIVIIGSAPEKYIRARSKTGKITFRYNERPYKNGINIKKFIYYSTYRKFVERNKVHMLCASAYTPYDFSLSGLYKNRFYKWGYFPKIEKYNIEKVLKSKSKASILWVARFIKFKHPETVIELAQRLKENNYDFSINMIGTGDLEKDIIKLIKEYGLENHVKVLGAMNPNEVRDYMKKSEIFLFTSDRGEGWGAVLNEAMNSGCAVVASHEIGSVPFLIENNKNGIIYENGNMDDLFRKVISLLSDEEHTHNIGLEAYHSMINLWNPQVAAKRFIELSNALLKGETFDKYTDGPCSKADLLKDNWYISK